MQQIDFANLKFSGTIKEEVLKEATYLKQIITVNAEFIVHANSDERFRQLINNNISTFDGQIPLVFAKRKHRTIRIDKISGSDLIYDICKQAQKNCEKVFLLGGYEESNRQAIIKLREKFPGLQIDGHSPQYVPYPFPIEHNDQILHRLNLFKPKYLFVGFGVKKQEFWIDDHKVVLQNIGVRFCVGSGGTFEMVSGQYKRAPKILQNIGLEGFYRFVKEPKLSRLKRFINCFKLFKYI